eukprot:TRINITY_DN57796_c0_g1_i1.p1 TRINITY_DN57796_c0_g1~~TRINITY_DN57796_c0_g1_i1.p1  ORF type:complete len:797 (-),score=76.26 TRINITY_DN57796_c0_g1_i1:289-2679(-)
MLFLVALVIFEGSSAQDALSDHPTLSQGLQSWWGKDAYTSASLDINRDLYAYDYHEPERKLAIVSALTVVLRRRMAGGLCSELPLSIAMHAWRYNQDELTNCLSLAPGPGDASRCSMSCSFTSGVSSLTCANNANLAGEINVTGFTGMAAAHECRHDLDERVVETSGGRVRGISRPSFIMGDLQYVSTYWGIPYAEPPQRLRQSKPLQSKWPGVRDSLDYDSSPPPPHAHHCPGLVPLDDGNGVEDCLTLDVHRPAKPVNVDDEPPRPVFVILFPNGFVGGDSLDGGILEPLRFVLRNDVVYVAPTYRTGFLGHWANPAMKNETEDGSFSNFALIDQRVALKWVQRNIRAFGGDPKRVTIFGHSSGAFMANFHLHSPASSGLFDQVILEGVTMDSGWYFQEASDAIEFYAQLGEHLGCPIGNDTTGREQLACLRRLPAQAFFELSNQQLQALLGRVSAFKNLWTLAKKVSGFLWSEMGFKGGFVSKGLSPTESPLLAGPLWPLLSVGIVVDGTSTGLPANPRQLYKSGRVNPARVYLDHATNEGTIFGAMSLVGYPWYESPTLTHAAVDAILKWSYGLDDVRLKQLLEIYPYGNGNDSPFYRLTRSISDSVFRCPAKRFARTAAKGSVFYSETTFSGDSSDGWFDALRHNDPMYFLGANHNNHPKWVFGPAGSYSGSAWSESMEKFMLVTNCHYASFLHCGDPGGCSGNSAFTPCQRLAAMAPAFNMTWPAFDPATGIRHRLDVVLDNEIVPSDLEERTCAFWDAAPAQRFSSNVFREHDRGYLSLRDSTLESVTV